MITSRRPRQKVAASSRDIQLTLFNKYDEAQIEEMENRRLNLLFERPCSRLTDRQERELDAVIEIRRREVRATWTQRVEAKRRSIHPEKGDMFIDSHGRILPRVAVLPVVVAGGDGGEESDGADG